MPLDAGPLAFPDAAHLAATGGRLLAAAVLGAGTILKLADRGEVHGLTTAASARPKLSLTERLSRPID